MLSILNQPKDLFSVAIPPGGPLGGTLEKPVRMYV